MTNKYWVFWQGMRTGWLAFNTPDFAQEWVDMNNEAFARNHLKFKATLNRETQEINFERA